jgi:hypothetical protein
MRNLKKSIKRLLNLRINDTRYGFCGLFMNIKDKIKSLDSSLGDEEVGFGGRRRLNSRGFGCPFSQSEFNQRIPVPADAAEQKISKDVEH